MLAALINLIFQPTMYTIHHSLATLHRVTLWTCFLPRKSPYNSWTCYNLRGKPIKRQYLVSLVDISRCRWVTCTGIFLHRPAVRFPRSSLIKYRACYDNLRQSKRKHRPSGCNYGRTLGGGIPLRGNTLRRAVLTKWQWKTMRTL